MSSVVLKGVSKQFGQNLIIPTLDLEVKSKEFMVLVGPSGCGKSTLLRMVAGLESLSTGEILIDGKNVTKTSPKERGVAMVFQNYALYPHMTVRENIIFPLKLAKVDKATREKKADEVAEVLDLTVHLDKKPGQLSGGQKQRVAMGRAMVRNPKVLLFDEPLSNLDAQLRVKMRSEIALLHKRLECTVLYVTHDQVEAMTLASRIVVLKRGNIEQLGAPLDVYHAPKTQFVASFIGTPSMNFLASDRVKEKTPNGCSTVGFRAEACALHGGTSATLPLGKGKVVLVEPIGHTAFVHLDYQNSRIVSEIPIQNSPEILSDCDIFVDPKKMFYFSTEGVRMEATP